MMRILILMVLACLCGCTGTGPASNPMHTSAPSHVVSPGVPVAATFSAEDARVIREFYQQQSISTRGKGKGKSKSLPPGIAKNLRRGKPLPPGIAKRALPHDLRIKLTRLPSGYDRYVVAGKILLVELGTQIVRDILTDVAFG